MNNPESLLARISVDPHVQHSRPCVKGTRTPVHIILEAIAMGMGIEEVKAEFPPITDEDIRACLLFAALLAQEEEVLLATSSAP